MTKSTCTVDGCERPMLAKGLCKAHYERNRRNGTLGQGIGPPRFMRAPRFCSVEGCGRRHKTNGFCNLHYLRLLKWGDPLKTAYVEGADHPQWAGEDVSYIGAHHRVKRLLGLAALHACVRCGVTAHEWAYDHCDPAERAGRHGDAWLTYSTDPRHYQPMCRSCHRRFDLEHRSTS